MIYFYSQYTYGKEYEISNVFSLLETGVKHLVFKYFYTSWITGQNHNIEYSFKESKLRCCNNIPILTSGSLLRQLSHSFTLKMLCIEK